MPSTDTFYPPSEVGEYLDSLSGIETRGLDRLNITFDYKSNLDTSNPLIPRRA